MTMTCAELEELLARGFPDLDMQRYAVEEATDDSVRVRLSVGKRDVRPGGTLLGPTLMEMADIAAYLCVLAPGDAGMLAVTTNLNIHFLRKPRIEDVLGVARTLKRGRRLCLVEVTMSTVGDPAPIAHATVSYALPSS